MITLPDFGGRAACASEDPALFFPETGDQHTARKAVAVCNRCLVKDECLAWALTHNENAGIWGGMSTMARDRVRPKKQAYGAAVANKDVNDARRARVVELTKAGQSLQEIAAVMGMHDRTVSVNRRRARELGEL